MITWNTKKILISLSLLCLILFILYYTRYISFGHSPSRKANLLRCQVNLEQIGKALWLYAADNNDFYPVEDGARGLNVLIEKNYLVDSKHLLCPLSHTIDENTSYIYEGGYVIGDKFRAICWDKESNHNEAINVLFSDNTVKKFENPDWKNKLRKYISNVDVQQKHLEAAK